MRTDLADSPVTFKLWKQCEEFFDDMVRRAQGGLTAQALHHRRVLPEPCAAAQTATGLKAASVRAPRRENVIWRPNAILQLQTFRGARAEVNGEPRLSILLPLHTDDLHAAAQPAAKQGRCGLIPKIGNEAARNEESKEPRLQRPTKCCSGAHGALRTSARIHGWMQALVLLHTGFFFLFARRATRWHEVTAGQRRALGCDVVSPSGELVEVRDDPASELVDLSEGVEFTPAIRRDEQLPDAHRDPWRAKCHAPIEPCCRSCSRNFANWTPPDLVHVPGPIAALNVSGSHASNMVTVCCTP
jgi:hypothetical protein